MRIVMTSVIALLLSGAASAAVQEKTSVDQDKDDCQFSAWPAGKSPREVGRKVAENVLSRPTGHGYTHACVYYGVLIFADAIGRSEEKSLADRVIEIYTPYRSGEKKPATGHVDNNVFGIVPLVIFDQTSDRECLSQGQWLADEEWEQPRDDGLTRYTRWWVDDAYMVPSLQAHAFCSTGEMKYADRGAAFMLAYVNRLQQSNGLFYHNTEWPYHWVRGNGWAAAGMTEMLLALLPDHPQRKPLLEAYCKMMKALVGCQEKTGMWPQLLDYPHVRPESSGTGMFVYGLATGVREGWLPDEPYAEAARRGWLALCDYVDAQGRVREVSCGTTSKELKRYLCDPRNPLGDFHGQAAVLWAAAAIERLEQDPKPNAMK